MLDVVLYIVWRLCIHKIHIDARIERDESNIAKLQTKLQNMADKLAAEQQVVTSPEVRLPVRSVRSRRVEPEPFGAFAFEERVPARDPPLGHDHHVALALQKLQLGRGDGPGLAQPLPCRLVVCLVGPLALLGLCL